MPILDEFADSVGVSVGAIKLAVTVYFGYIVAAIHRKFLFAKSPVLQHLFFSFIGLSLLYWNYGFGFVHNVICVIVQWLVLQVLGPSVLSVGITFAFQLGYLVAGYIYVSTSDYDINWTMPHCILTLRLIGLCFDVYDGHRDQEKVTAEQKTLMVKDIPGLLEMFGFCYFIGGFHVGPQFPLRKYRLLVNGQLTDVPGKRPHSVVPAFRRCVSGTLVLAVQVLVDMYFPESMYQSQEFYRSSVFWRIFIISVRGHILLYRYLAIWIINEGVCILSGLGYHKEGDKVKWDAVRNILLRKFAIAKSFQELIESFNINTNQWIARYVFKRLKFVGNRTVSHLAALYFLAVWHGYHEGYFTCFTYEFLVMTVERPVREALHQSTVVKFLKSSKSTSWIPSAVGFLYVRFLMGYSVLDFSLRKWRWYSPIYMSVYYYGHFFYLFLWILLKLYNSMKKSKAE